MSQYVRWFILSLPILALLLLWSRLPLRIVIHLASGDKWVTRDDFGGLVVGATVAIALFAFGLLQVQMGFRPFSPRALSTAYTTLAVGSALIGLTLLGIGLWGQ